MSDTLEEALQRAEGELAEPISCERAEAIIAALLAGPVAPATEGALDAHLASCEPCAELADAAGGTEVGDVILDFGAVPEKDLPDLAPVARDLYVRGHEVGRGGMGRIVRARDRRLGRAVAIKELLDDRLRARFEREARLTARLQHPGVVNVLEAGRWEDGAPFYAMKYVAGRPLSEALAGKRTLAGRLGYLPNLIAAVDAIAYAHSERIVHRDLKPHNILIGPFGETVVVDWGLAKDLTDGVSDTEPVPSSPGETPLTRAGAGTPGYMPPEQARGESPDERVDVFALGATLYHLLAGHPPDQPIAAASPDAPAELAAIVDKAMALLPGDRYPSAAELADELKRFQTGQLVRAHQYSLGQLLRRWLRRHRVPVAIIASAAVLFVVIGSVALSRVLEARRDAVSERDRTEEAHGDLLVELARQDLLAGAASDAADKLREARALGARGVTARFLAAEAQRRMWRQVRVLPAAVLRFPETAMVFTADGDLVVDHIVWDLATGGVAATLVGPPPATGPGRRLEAAGEWLLDSRPGAPARLWSLLDGTSREVGAGQLVGDAGEVLTVGEALVLGKVTLRPREGRRFLAGAVAPNLERIATVEDSGLAVIWDLQGREVRRLGRVGGDRLSFSPTSRTLLTVSAGAARHWDLATGVEVGRFSVGAGDLRWSRDGAWIAVVEPDADRQVRLLDARGDVHGTLALDARPALVEFVGDTSRLLTVAASTATLWDTSGRALSASRLSGVAHAAALHPDGNVVAVAGTDGTRVYKLPQDIPGVYLWDTGVAAVGFGAAGQLAVVDAEGAIALYDARGKVVIRERAPKGWRPSETVVAWVGDRVMVMGPESGLAVVDAGGQDNLPGMPGWSNRRLFATRRGLVVFGSSGEGPRLELWDPDGERTSLLPPEVQPARAHHVDPDCRIAIVESADLLLWRLDLATRRATPLISRRGAPEVVVSPDGRWLALARGGGTEIWELLGPRLVGRTRAPLDLPAQFVGRDGALLVAAPPGPPERWTVRGDGTIARETLPGTSEHPPVFRTDAALYAETMPSGRMRLLAGMRTVAEYPPMRPIVFSDDGQRLVVTLGKEVRLLDVGEAP